MEGRYRLEAVLHDDLIFLFGGGRPDFVTELRTVSYNCASLTRYFAF